MKIRNGFVSNSSSSSFVISINDFKNVFELAEYMIKQMDVALSKKDIINRLKTSKKDPNTPVMFYSCNYDTYISKHDDHYLINTCNNEDWNLDNYACSTNVLDSELVNNWDEIDFDKIHENLKFWNIEQDHIFKMNKEWISCERKDENNKRLCGYSDMVIINDELQCPYCYHTKDGKPSRYLLYKNRDKKLERINKE